MPSYACPLCRAPLNGGLRCEACARRFSVREGIPVLLADPDEQKVSQAGYFDAPASPGWEVTRPFGAPRFHSYILGSKVARAIAGLGGFATGASALVVCGGSGMDAQFLALRGFATVTSDISFGACLRAVGRSRRFGVALTAVVADAEQLPFQDRSFDLVFVHDGLHHLDRPYAALDEMLRVARRAVSVNEPAAATATRVASALGVAATVEEAGNEVRRMSLAAIRARCTDAGFDVVEARRYAMFYRHEPGLPMRVLSQPGLFTAGRVGLSVANRLIGGIGNKLTVQAVRRA